MGLLGQLFGDGSPGALEIGARMPQVSACDDAGKSWDFAQEFSAGWVLIYFYPKAHTPGCNAQACSLRDGYEDLAEREVRVVGVSHDGGATLAGFRKKYGLPFVLMSDAQAEVMSAFGVKRHLGFYTARQAYLFRDGKLVWRDLSASTADQAKDVLEVLDRMG